MLSAASPAWPAAAAEGTAIVATVAEKTAVRVADSDHQGLKLRL
jgi:hypothetical protein